MCENMITHSKTKNKVATIAEVPKCNRNSRPTKEPQEARNRRPEDPTGLARAVSVATERFSAQPPGSKPRRRMRNRGVQGSGPGAPRGRNSRGPGAPRRSASARPRPDPERLRLHRGRRLRSSTRKRRGGSLGSVRLLLVRPRGAQGGVAGARLCAMDPCAALKRSLGGPGGDEEPEPEEESGSEQEEVRRWRDRAALWPGPAPLPLTPFRFPPLPQELVAPGQGRRRRGGDFAAGFVFAEKGGAGPAGGSWAEALGQARVKVRRGARWRLRGPPRGSGAALPATLVLPVLLPSRREQPRAWTRRSPPSAGAAERR